MVARLTTQAQTVAVSVEQKASANMAFYILILALPPTLVALAVALDRRSRRGYGLGLLAAVALALDLWGIIAFTQAAQQVSAAHTDNLDVAIVEAVYTLIGWYLALVLVFGAIAETIIARQRRWLAIIIAVCVVLAAIIIVPWTALVPDVLGALGLSRGVEVVLLLLVPVLLTLAYALTRTFWPVAPRAPRGSQGTLSPLSR